MGETLSGEMECQRANGKKGNMPSSENLDRGQRGRSMEGGWAEFLGERGQKGWQRSIYARPVKPSVTLLIFEKF